jgi:N-methylhydantoinase B/oxoprolinase/acetone carboxylase alpha subunit
MAQKEKITIETLAIMMQKGLAELYELLSHKPDREEVKTMIREEVKAVVKEEVKAAIKEDIAVVREDIDRLSDRVGRLGDKIDENRTGQYQLERIVERHEKWHRQTAQKIGIKLEN